MNEIRRSCETHCCARHGCKYGHEDCPVVGGEIRQAYPCEQCGTPADELQREVERLSARVAELEAVRDEARRHVEAWVNGEALDMTTLRRLARIFYEARSPEPGEED
jgi:hypothetical protein